MPLFDPKGNLISSHKKATPPKLGEAFAPNWMGDRDRTIFTMPGGGTVMFDLSKLTLADFRSMRDHYQINATLRVLSFMVHQMDWRIECDNAKIAKHVTENLREMWTPFVRAISQSFWAGYSPNVLQWENDTSGRTVQLTKVKDIIPEEAIVHWKKVDGYAPPNMVPPKIKVYDGISIYGQQWPVPSENSFWYPLLMENGDMYGQKLLRPVFTSWYFSLLIHLFSNRYFERFGEPVPVGRAPYDEEINVSGQSVRGSDLMVQVLQNLRNRSVVVLPNDRSPVGTGGQTEYDYAIEYLESQMRGADFERYLMRLDEEMSIGMLTPLLILRTADVGSYNLGTVHWNMYLNMLNAIVGDLKSYTDPYIIDRMVDLNFGKNAPRARIVFRKMGDDKLELVKALLQSMVGKGTVKPDLQELGDIAGLSLEEIQVLTSDGTGGTPGGTTQPGQDKKKSSSTGGSSAKSGSSGDKKKASKNTRAVVREVVSDLSKQLVEFVNSYTDGANFSANLSREEELIAALELDGYENAFGVASMFKNIMCSWASDLPISYLRDRGPWGLLKMIEYVAERQLDSLVSGKS